MALVMAIPQTSLRREETASPLLTEKPQGDFAPGWTSHGEEKRREAVSGGQLPVMHEELPSKVVGEMPSYLLDEAFLPWTHVDRCTANAAAAQLVSEEESMSKADGCTSAVPKDCVPKPASTV